MAIGLTEVLVFSLLAVAWKRSGKKGEFGAERKKIYEAALENLTDPEKLNRMADEFDTQGLPIQAAMLRKRAELRSLPRERIEEYHKIRDKALQSDNVDAILKLADAFESLSATGEAKKLRDHAAEVTKRKLSSQTQLPFDTPVKNHKKPEVIEVKAEVVQDSPAIHGEK